MNRKLLILDAVLLALLVYAGVQFRNLRQAAQARESAKLPVRVTPSPAPPSPPSPTPQAVIATSYIQIPDKFLLDPSRNSVVVPPPPPPPPPPKPMPAVPVYHGQMNLMDGAGVFAILSLNNAAPHQAIHIGETIGQFKLLSVNKEGIDLEWDGKTVHKTLAEMTDHGPPPQQQEAAPERAVAAAAPLPPVEQKPLGPGAVTAMGVAACQPNDSNPEGTVVNGFRKTSRKTPFGSMCYWEPVGGTGGR